MQVGAGSFQYLQIDVGVLAELWWSSQKMNCQSRNLKSYGGSFLMYVCPGQWRLMVPPIARQMTVLIAAEVSIRWSKLTVPHFLDFGFRGNRVSLVCFLASRVRYSSEKMKAHYQVLACVDSSFCHPWVFGWIVWCGFGSVPPPASHRSVAPLDLRKPLMKFVAPEWSRFWLRHYSVHWLLVFQALLSLKFWGSLSKCWSLGQGPRTGPPDTFSIFFCHISCGPILAEQLFL